MKNQITILFLVLSVLVSAVTNAQDLNAYQVINKAIDAMGGKQNLQSVRTLYTDFKTEMEGRPVNWVVREMIPNKGSFQIIYEGRVVYENRFNGTSGVEIVGGERKAADPAEFADKRYKKNIFNELDYLDSSLYKLELLPDTKVGSEACYKVKATLANGTVRHLYFSKVNSMIIKEEKVKGGEKDDFETVLYSGFKQFGDFTFYTEMRLGAGSDAPKVTLVKFEVNKKVDEKDFQ